MINTGVASFAQERRVRVVAGAPHPGHGAPHPALRAKNVPLLCRLPERVDVVALSAAVRALVERHPVLQYRFLHRDGRVSLRWAGAGVADVECAVVDRSALGTADGAVRAFLRAQVDAPFDLLGWPLLRAGVIQDDRPLFYLCADHTVCDGWSMTVAMRDIEAAYTGLLRGRTVELRPPGDYLRYSAAQRRRYTSGPAVERAVDGVRAMLAGRAVEPAFPLPAAPWDAEHGRYTEFDLLDAAAAGRLLDYCRSRRATPYMAVLAAFGVAAREIAGRAEVGVLVAMHNRDERHTADSVGWYANMLALYFPTFPVDRFDDGVRAVRDRLMRLLVFAELPLSRVADDLADTNDNGAGVRFPTCFISLTDARTPPSAGGSGRWEQLDLAPSYRMGYGLWVVLHDTGLRAVTASPRTSAGVASLAGLESRIADVLRSAAVPATA
ncbi:hypothetical protein Drose_14940 [Dactylosporangium roseum]|uniref:Condensation domain-containing protein n=1 Tax=Dactylosporangium roseum TaxID=47989 RepID=A0ABY5ZBK8_9ACTN|nr:condensation domain-containing protein [Dactylosporangium roseum]UWZ39416.1 hypothetical protein Drose_14940 [Dactylosporangium roseum]